MGRRRIGGAGAPTNGSRLAAKKPGVGLVYPPLRLVSPAGHSNFLYTTWIIRDPEANPEQESDVCMKTLVFCTAFAGSHESWELRYRRWLDAVRSSGLRFDQILLVDDGSDVLPAWPDLTIVNSNDVGSAEELVCPDPCVLYHFDDNLGRNGVYDFPGWYRSFGFAARYAASHGFDKVVHLESDAYLISRRLIDYVNSCRSGWTTLWCPRYEVPELAVQIIAADQIFACASFFAKPYALLAGRKHESSVPYTRVVRSFVGDRYGEAALSIPRNADYAAQVEIHCDPAYYWWLSDELRSQAEADQADRELVVEFGTGGNSDQFVGSGWSFPEPTLRWMVGTESEMVLPSPWLSANHDQLLLISLIPCLHKKALIRQRLQIDLNGEPLLSMELDCARAVGLELPARLLGAANGDERLLALAARRMIIRRLTKSREPLDSKLCPEEMVGT
jgi:hypothetical protein